MMIRLKVPNSARLVNSVEERSEEHSVALAHPNDIATTFAHT